MKQMPSIIRGSNCNLLRKTEPYFTISYYAYGKHARRDNITTHYFCVSKEIAALEGTELETNSSGSRHALKNIASWKSINLWYQVVKIKQNHWIIDFIKLLFGNIMHFSKHRVVLNIFFFQREKKLSLLTSSGGCFEKRDHFSSKTMMQVLFPK